MATPEEKLAAIAAILGDDVHAPAPAPAVPWWKDTSTPAPTGPLVDVTNVDEIKRYCAHGYRTNFTRGVAPSDWDTYIARFADPISRATTPQEADAVVQGAGSFAQDVAILLVLGGGVQGVSPFMTPSIYAPWGSGFDMVQAAAWLVGSTGYAGPSGQ